jgi:hypothetical protein
MNDRVRTYRKDWLERLEGLEGWKQDEGRSMLFGLGSKEEDIPLDREENVIRRIHGYEYA